ncbi:MAG: CHAT domain-containing protein [bacterium]
MAESLAREGHADSAMAALDRGISRALTRYALSDSTVPLYLYEEGVPALYFLGRYDEAESLFTRAVEIAELISGTESEHAAGMLIHLSEVYQNHIDHGNSLKCRERALAIMERIRPANHASEALVLSGVATNLVAKRDLDLASALADSSVRLAQASEGRQSPLYARCLMAQGDCMRVSSLYSEAESLYTEASRIAVGVLGERSRLATSCLARLAYVLRRKDAREEARSMFKKAAGTIEEVEGPLSPLLGWVYHGIGLVTVEQEDYLEGEQALERAVSIYANCLGRRDSRTLTSMYALATTYGIEGKIREAEALGREVLAGREELLGPRHPMVAWSLYGVGICAWDLGDYAEAEDLMMRALRIREEVLGPEHHFVGQTLNGLSGLYRDMGRYDESIALVERSLSILEKKVGQDNSDYARTLSSVAAIEEERGNLDTAAEVTERVVEINNEVFGRESAKTASQLSSLADIYAAQERYAQAESLYHRALVAFRAVEGVEYPQEAWPLTGLGSLYTTQGRYPDADSVLTHALTVWDAYLGGRPVDDNVVYALEGLCRLKRLCGLNRQAIEMAKRAFDIRLAIFLNNSRAFAEPEALTLSHQVRWSADLYLSCLFELEDRTADDDREAFDVILATKGEVSDAVLERQQLLVGEDDPAVLAIADTLGLVKNRLSGLFVEGPGTGAQGHADLVDSLSRFAGELETRLARLSRSYGKRYEDRGIGIARVEDALPEGAVLLEYYGFNYIDPNSGDVVPHYLAGRACRGRDPLVEDLGPADRVNKPVELYLDHMQRIAASGRLPSVIDKIEYERLDANIYSAALEPVVSGLTDEDLLLIAPDGALNLVSFAGLSDPDGEYLITRRTIHYVSSGRDIARFAIATDTGTGLFALGNPDFDLLTPGAIPDGGEPTLVAMRNLRSICPDFQNLSVSALPGTRMEVERISAAWETSTPEPIEVCLGAEASEDNFRSKAPGSRVIHLATHGYFLGAACRVKPDPRALNKNKRFAGENPLLHSGLLFSGANVRKQNAGSLDSGQGARRDGVLTAYEVSGMNLAGTDLVVLSACETGLGEVQAGEGVYGLRRAFQMAGARTVVSALWPVSDEATAGLMSRLYLEAGPGLAYELKEAQLRSIDLLRKAGATDHPFTWAAFIAVGDWE